MNLKLEDKVRINKKIIFKEVDGVVYIFDPRSSLIHTLNRTASFIWLQLTVSHSLNEIVNLLIKEFDVKKEKALKDAKKFLQNYLKQNFVLSLDKSKKQYL